MYMCTYIHIRVYIHIYIIYHSYMLSVVFYICWFLRNYIVCKITEHKNYWVQKLTHIITYLLWISMDTNRKFIFCHLEFVSNFQRCAKGLQSYIATKHDSLVFIIRLHWLLSRMLCPCRQFSFLSKGYKARLYNLFSDCKLEHTHTQIFSDKWLLL